MKRFLICALSVGLLASTALAAEPDVTVWVQGTDGGSKITLGVSQTAIIQVWASIGTAGGNQPVTSVDLFLDARDSTFAIGSENFDVVGFNNQTYANSQSQRLNRGAIFTDGTTGLPGSLNDYQFIAFDPTSVNGTDGFGFPYPRSILLDEIIIHGVTQNVLPDGTKNSDIVNFSLGGQNPIGFYMQSVFGSWNVAQLTSVAQGTGDALGTFMTVNVTPEPATLGLIALGGLAAIRRRRG